MPAWQGLQSVSDVDIAGHLARWLRQRQRLRPLTDIAAAFLAACAAELAALKPGNVHVHAAGHGMTVEDFAAAPAAAPAIAAAGAPVGERVRRARRGDAGGRRPEHQSRHPAALRSPAGGRGRPDPGPPPWAEGGELPAHASA